MSTANFEVDKVVTTTHLSTFSSFLMACHHIISPVVSYTY